MKIAGSTIAMSAQSEKVQNYSKEESLKMWVGNERPDFENVKQPQTPQVNFGEDILNISEEAKAKFAEAASMVGITGEKDEDIFELSDKDKQKIFLIQKMLERLTGKKFTFVLPKKIKINNPELCIKQPNKVISTETQQTPRKAGFGVEYESHESYSEKSKMSFSAKGIVKTSDGREISLDLQLNMSREFEYKKDVVFLAGDAKMKDPLVINIGDMVPSLTDKKYAFDIDSDGTMDNISFVDKGSGFIALDKNGDGTINNGTELFGAQSGDGFAELSEYDTDKNNWIDENDKIYENLRIWQKDEAGNDKLIALGEAGVGAIYLGHVSSAFEMKDTANNLQGKIQNSGIYLKESGQVGTIQHIDLVV